MSNFLRQKCNLKKYRKLWSLILHNDPQSLQPKKNKERIKYAETKRERSEHGFPSHINKECFVGMYVRTYVRTYVRNGK